MSVITVLHEQRETSIPDPTGEIADGQGLWLDAESIEQATGWRWKPQGLCFGDDICVPLPSGRPQDTPDAADSAPPDERWVRDGRLNLAAMWRRSGQPVVHDADSRTWVLGTGAGQRASGLATLVAPDFALTDLQGRTHRLSDHRGRKVFLVTWASW